MFGMSKLLRKEDPLWQQYRAEAEKKALMTPDLAYLKECAMVNIFVYDDMQTNQPNNRKLEGGMYRGFGYTKASDFVLYKKLLGKETFPFALQITEDQRIGMSSYIGDPGQIVGEVYTLFNPSDKIIDLDSFVLNTVYYDRKIVPVLIPYKTDPNAESFEIKEIEAFMYIGSQEFWGEQLSSHEGKSLFKQSQRIFGSKEIGDNLGAYYTFDYNVEARK